MRGSLPHYCNEHCKQEDRVYEKAPCLMPILQQKNFRSVTLKRSPRVQPWDQSPTLFKAYIQEAVMGRMSVGRSEPSRQSPYRVEIDSPSTRQSPACRAFRVRQWLERICCCLLTLARIYLLLVDPPRTYADLALVDGRTFHKSLDLSKILSTTTS